MRIGADLTSRLTSGNHSVQGFVPDYSLGSMNSAKPWPREPVSTLKLQMTADEDDDNDECSWKSSRNII